MTQEKGLGQLVDAMLRLTVEHPAVVINPNGTSLYHKQYQALRDELNAREPEYLRTAEMTFDG